MGSLCSIVAEADDIVADTVKPEVPLLGSLQSFRPLTIPKPYARTGFITGAYGVSRSFIYSSELTHASGGAGTSWDPDTSWRVGQSCLALVRLLVQVNDANGSPMQS